MGKTHISDVIAAFPDINLRQISQNSAAYGHAFISPRLTRCGLFKQHCDHLLIPIFNSLESRDSERMWLLIQSRLPSYLEVFRLDLLIDLY